MPRSAYLTQLRAQVGNSFLLLPAVSAVIQRGDRFLVARQRDSGLWSLVGGAVEPGESPRKAVAREVTEELAMTPAVGGVIGAYGGPSLEITYPNGDRVGYVTTAYRCSLPSDALAVDPEELLEVRWIRISELTHLNRHQWIDQVLRDAQARPL